jgi:hypothetical protein
MVHWSFWMKRIMKRLRCKSKKVFWPGSSTSSISSAFFALSAVAARVS